MISKTQPKSPNSAPLFELLDYNSLNPGLLAIMCYSALSCVWLFAILWAVPQQSSLSIEFPRQEYWNELPFPNSRGSSRTRDGTCTSPVSPQWQEDSLPLVPIGKPKVPCTQATQKQETWKDHFETESKTQGCTRRTVAVEAHPELWDQKPQRINAN